MVPIPIVSASADAAVSVDGLKPLVGDGAISDVFHQLLLSIQALQSQVGAEASAEEADVLDEVVVDVDEETADTEDVVVAVNLDTDGPDAPKGLLTALESLKAAIESRKELAALPQQAQASKSGSKPAEAMSARVAMQKLDELLLGYSQASEGEEAVEDGELPLQAKKPVTLGDLIKPLALEGEVGTLAKETGLEPLRSGVTKPDPPPLAPLEAAGGETAKVKEAAPASDKQAVNRPLEPPTIRTVGDFTVRSVRHLLGSEQESIQIRLVPRSLGELHIAVTTVRDAIEVTVTAASGLVRDVLDAQLTGLKDALARDGVEVSKITVHNSSLADLGGQFAQAQSQAAQRQAQQGPANPLPLSAEEGEELALETAAVAGSERRGVSHDGDLDMRA